MNSRERVATALRCEQPDRVPYIELAIDRSLAEKIMGWERMEHSQTIESAPYTIDEMVAVADELAFDNLCYVLRAPVYSEMHVGEDGRLFYGDGLIRSEADMHLLDLPDPHDQSLYDDAKRFVDRKGERSAWFATRIGVLPAMLSMGIQTFSLAIYDNRPFLEHILDVYCEWAAVVAENICKLGFDAYATTDDMAFNTQPFFSPAIFRDLVVPRFREVAANITVPWIAHSDGNIMPFLPDLIDLGISGIHPLEKGAMDVAEVKRLYGDRICLLGNIDLNILGLGTTEETDREVYELIQMAGYGGGYIVSSGNSLASYCKPENVRALSAAVQKYGRYPLQKFDL